MLRPILIPVASYSPSRETANALEEMSVLPNITAQKRLFSIIGITAMIIEKFLLRMEVFDLIHRVGGDALCKSQDSYLVTMSDVSRSIRDLWAGSSLHPCMYVNRHPDVPTETKMVSILSIDVAWPVEKISARRVEFKGVRPTRRQNRRNRQFRPSTPDGLKPVKQIEIQA